jgi:tRNA pseudouridine38-40 synthase
LSTDDLSERAGPASGGALKLTIGYHGAAFSGSQRQPGRATVQAALEQAAETLARTPVRVTLAGRTDEGVHAAGQVASLPDPRPEWSTGRLRLAFDALVPDSCSVQRVERVPDEFHARFDAQWREYRYRIWSGPRAALARDLVWERHAPLNLALANDGATRLVGERDFAAFAGGGEGVPWSSRRSMARGTVRTLHHASVRRIDPWWGPAYDGELVEIRVVADGFLPRMVRTIAGALAAIGQGQRPPEWIDELLAAKDRRQAGETAPPHGLILWRVGYDGETPEE